MGVDLDAESWKIHFFSFLPQPPGGGVVLGSSASHMIWRGWGAGSRALVQGSLQQPLGVWGGSLRAKEAARGGGWKG